MDASPSLSSAQPFTLASDPGARSMMDVNNRYNYPTPRPANKNTFTGEVQNRVLDKNFATGPQSIPLPFSEGTSRSTTFTAQ